MKKNFTSHLVFLLTLLISQSYKTWAQCSFSGLAPNYCTNSSSVNLTPSVLGGSFSGPGIFGNSFNPSVAGPGTHTITYGSCNSTYSITTGSYSPAISTTVGTGESLGDDQVSSNALPIGFTFQFYCNNYTTFYISSNGFITFNNNGANGCCSGASMPSFTTPDNLIALAWEDLYPPAGGSITYTTIGTAPNRKLIVNYDNIQHFSSGNPVTGQIILYETSNIIELHTLSMPSDGGNHTMGLQNSGGTVAHVVSGRNSSNWSITVSEMQRFTPGNSACATQTTVVSPSTVSISGSNSVCIGSSVNLTASGNTTYTWSTNSNLASINVSPSSNTTYSVSATNSFGCVSSSAITVTVNTAVPSSTVTASSNSICLGASVSISAAGAPTYTFSGGISNGVAFTPTATTVYTITGGNACGNVNTLQTITVAPLGIATLSTPTLVCAGNTASLTAGGASSYTWMPGNISGANIIVSPIAPTVYTVTGVTGSCSGVATISVAANPNPTILTTASSSVICAGTTVTLTASGANTYTWQPVNMTGASIAVTPTAPAAYIVSGTNSFGCTTSTTQVVIANASPIISVIASSNLICLGGSATLTAAGGTNYSWDFGSTNAVEVVSPVVSTNYTVTSTNPTTGCSTSQVVNVGVFTQTLAVSNSTAICMGQSITLNASGGTTYSWSTGSTASSIFVFPTVSTVYTVSAITVTNNMNCSSAGSVSLTVNPNPTVTAVLTKTVFCKGETATITASGASTYSWNTNATTSTISISPSVNTNYTVTGKDANGCVNTTTIQAKVSSCVGIAEMNVENYELSIYPNPSNGEFTVKSDISINLNLINELGQIVKNINLSGANNYQINVTNLANGIYFIVGRNDEVKVNQKIIVAK